MIIRETIYAALWQLGANAARFATANRRLRHWADVAPAEQPALYMSEKGAHAAVKKLGAPIVWTLYAEFFLYAHSCDPFTAPGTIINPLLDALVHGAEEVRGVAIKRNIFGDLIELVGDHIRQRIFEPIDDALLQRQV